MSERRFRLMHDNDGHQFAVPVDLEAQFYEWVSAMETYQDYEPDFDQYRVDGTLTFTDPQP